jgi:hypothetical protein
MVLRSAKKSVQFTSEPSNETWIFHKKFAQIEHFGKYKRLHTVDGFAIITCGKFYGAIESCVFFNNIVMLYCFKM